MRMHGTCRLGGAVCGRAHVCIEAPGRTRLLGNAYIFNECVTAVEVFTLSYAMTNNAGVEDADIASLTNQVNVTNFGDATLGTSGGFIADVVIPADKYLYLACGDAGNAVYTKGKFLITLYGTV